MRDPAGDQPGESGHASSAAGENRAGQPDKPDRAAFEQWRAEVEESMASVERGMHELLCQSEISTGAPQVDAALRQFALTWGKRIADYGDRTDELLAGMAKAVEDDIRAAENADSSGADHSKDRDKPSSPGGAAGDSSESLPPE